MILEPTAQEILGLAKRFGLGRRGTGYKDDKADCGIQDILILLDAGASIVRLNAANSGKKYIHEVEYDGHLFQATTEAPSEELKRYAK